MSSDFLSVPDVADDSSMLWTIILSCLFSLSFCSATSMATMLLATEFNDPSLAELC